MVCSPFLEASRMTSPQLSCRRTYWKRRESYTLSNGLIRLVTLTGGGHIAELQFEDATGLPTCNPMWAPPWSGIEPYRYRAEIHAAKYGPLPGGKLLSGIAGHSICLDYFGAPSPEEIKLGLALHGEAPSSRWQKTVVRVSSREAALTLAAKLPAAGLRFRRELRVRRGESVVYFEETVTNERAVDHFFHWTQHVTLGPPFLSRRDSLISLPGTKALTFPHGYDEGNAFLASKREFYWPKAPQIGGGAVDLTRPFSHPGRGFIAGVLLDTARELGFVAALNLRERMLIAYCFPRRDFPWVAVWEENCAITAAPWNRRTQARGLEFGTTPLPLARRENFLTGGPLFGVPTLAHVPARGTRVVRYATLLACVPASFTRITNIELRGHVFRIIGAKSGESLEVSASGALAVFSKDSRVSR